MLSRIEATKYNKNLRSAPESKAAWARVLQRGMDASARPLDARDINYDTLRLARIRLHAFCCLLWRVFFHGLDTDIVDLYLYSDGSPQWRGVEMLASSFDIRIPGTRALIKY